MSKNIDLYVRNIVFGISDSLVSTVGLLSGIDVSGTSRQVIILTGVVYAFVEAFSMAVGSFLSEESAEEYAVRGEVPDGKPLVAGIVMFISFILASFIPIVPYLFCGLGVALWLSIALSIVALFIVGLVSADIIKVHVFKHAIKMALLGGAAIVIGVIVGKFVKTA
jgi:VIT1/CCC1 family predicted Fe2+/Mn2+ transporter